MKAAILGTENSHADAFAKLIKNDPDFADIELIGAYGYDPAANDRLAKAGLCTRFEEKPDDFLNEADAVLVTARHGDHHYEYALPYLKAGKAAFIDKPFTVNEAYAKKLIEVSKASGALICGGSSLKFLDGLQPLRAFAEDGTVLGGTVGAPVNMVNDYAGFYFYSQHLIEMMFTVFGKNVRAVTAVCPDREKNRVSVIFDYGDFDVTAQYTSSYEYSVCVLTEKGSHRLAVTELGNIYKSELAEFAGMVRSGKAPYAPEELMCPVTLLHAVERAYMEGKTQYLRQA